MQLAVAVIPSNQSSNLAPSTFPAPYNGYSEAGGMRLLGQAVVKHLIAHGVTAQYFEPALESADHYQYESLYTAFSAARSFLNAHAASAKTCCIHLHTDAADKPENDASHTSFCYSTTVADSKALGRAVGVAVQAALGTAGLHELNYTDWMFDKQLRPHVSVICECCAHDVLSDLQALYGRLEPCAEAVATGVLTWAGVGPAPAVDWQARAQAAEAKLNQIKSIVG